VHDNRIKKIVVVGGGTAGWMAAALIPKLAGRDMEVELIESKQIGSVGVGEATIPQIRLLLDALQIQEQDFLKHVQGTYKLGIEFCDWGKLGDSYIHTFGDVGRRLGVLDFHQVWLRGKQLGLEEDFWKYSFNDRAARANKFAPVEKLGNTGLLGIGYAFHFDASMVATYLSEYAAQFGVKHTDGLINQVKLNTQTGFIDAAKTLLDSLWGNAPEVEVGLHLTQCGWSGAPPLVGWLEYIPTGKEQGGAVASVHKAITPSMDAWEYSIQTLLQGVDADAELIDMACRIGTLTAGMHEALATTEDSAAFSPQAPSEKEQWETTCSMSEHARSVWDLLSTADVPAVFQQRVNDILAKQQIVLDALEALARLQPTAAYIRVHGDYHLGQLLINKSDRTLHVIDFEGEPRRTLAE